ncbi:hypothetical protein ACS0TY_003183 [Phlomoides rotata]
MEPTSSAGLRPPSAKIMRRSSATSIDTLGNDALCLIFAFLDLVHLIRCSAVCKSWGTVIKRLKLLQIQYHKQHQTGCPAGVPDLSNYPEVLINAQMEQVAMDQQRLSLKDGPVDIFQWKAHAVGFRKCRMKMGLILTGVGDKVMRLWSAESCRGLDEYLLPDMPLIDFDFDEGKVVGLVGTRICIWKRSGTRSLFSSHQGLFTNGLCMSYVDPQAVVGCEDGKVRVFDMYSRQISQLIKYVHSLSSQHFINFHLFLNYYSQKLALLDTYLFPLCVLLSIPWCSLLFSILLVPANVYLFTVFGQTLIVFQALKCICKYI